MKFAIGESFLTLRRRNGVTITFSNYFDHNLALDQSRFQSWKCASDFVLSKNIVKICIAPSGQNFPN